jgi:peptidoglycan/LPS O-acetylase OafA/YrhL
VGLEVGPFHRARTVSAMFFYLAVVPLVSLVAAVPLYLLVEKPIMNLRERFSRARGGA